jgi:septation ring formation regulator EzrA
MFWQKCNCQEKLKKLEDELISLSSNLALIKAKVEANETNVSSLRNAFNRRGKKFPDEEEETKSFNSLTGLYE